MSRAKYYKSTYNAKIYAERDGEQWCLVTEVIHLIEVPGRQAPLMHTEKVAKHYWSEKIDDTKLDFSDTHSFQETSKLEVVVLYGLGEPEV